MVVGGGGGGVGEGGEEAVALVVAGPVNIFSFFLIFKHSRRLRNFSNAENASS